MKPFIQKIESGWWKQNLNTQFYALREYSAIFIAIWAIFTTTFLLIPHLFNQNTKTLIDTIGLIGAVTHTLTWLQVMPKLAPFRISEVIHLILFLILIGIWITLSYLIIIWI